MHVVISYWLSAREHSHGCQTHDTEPFTIDLTLQVVCIFIYLFIGIFSKYKNEQNSAFTLKLRTIIYNIFTVLNAKYNNFHLNKNKQTSQYKWFSIFFFTIFKGKYVVAKKTK